MMETGPTYVQHKTKGTVLGLSTFHDMCTRKTKKIQTDRKVHLHEANS